MTPVHPEAYEKIIYDSPVDLSINKEKPYSTTNCRNASHELPALDNATINELGNLKMNKLYLNRKNFSTCIVLMLFKSMSF